MATVSMLVMFLAQIVTATLTLQTDNQVQFQTCNLTGYWTYDPEPGHNYVWQEDAVGNVGCFKGLDGWHEATAKIVDTTVTITFADPRCFPNRSSVGQLDSQLSSNMPPIVKHGVVNPECTKIVMDDVQPNCAAGHCSYSRIPPPPPPLPPCTSTNTPIDVEWLACRSKAIIAGCKENIQPNSPLNRNGTNATVAFTPDATHSYGAQWTRDFYYMVSGASSLMDADVVKESVRYTYMGQRGDGCMPDRVQIDGMSVMAPGGMLPGNKRNPQHDHAWDNGPFAALLLATTVTAWPDKILFCELEPQARKALDFVNRSSNHLVFNDVGSPNATYGFTDTVAKTGNLLFTSLLYIDASRQLATLSRQYGCGNATQYSLEADGIAANIDIMKDPKGPLWLAATVDNNIPDVWGSAYLVMLNLSTSTARSAAMAEMVANVETYFRNGQVRSIPQPWYWTRCFGGGCPAHGTYQNGAFWATPLSYVVPALISTGHTNFAQTLVAACISDFKQYGVYEDVDRGFPATSKGVLNYTASATNVLIAARLLA